MENPSTRSRAEHVVAEAIANFDKMQQNHICGLSEVAMIVAALRSAGLLRDEDEDEDEDL